jgi:hypothetical protein
MGPHQPFDISVVVRCQVFLRLLMPKNNQKTSKHLPSQIFAKSKNLGEKPENLRTAEHVVVDAEKNIPNRHRQLPPAPAL